MSRLTILSVGYPLAPVSPDAAGGAEQILATLDRALVAAGHRSVVIAPQGSRVAGELRPIASRPGPLDDAAKLMAQAETRVAVEACRAAEPIDLIHLHGIDFAAYLPSPGGPVLATLHLPPDWYPPSIFSDARPETWLHTVSAAQHADCPALPNLLPPIENGVPVDALQARHARRAFALFLGRICPEKGVHLAIEASRRARVPLLIAGQVYDYAEHRAYFEREVAPHLGPDCRFLGSLEFVRKRRFLTAARCLLVPSLAAETSSLVAREAAACGTPVIAFRRGALPATVEDGRTGFVVDDVLGMSEAIEHAATIDPALCRDVAARRFSERSMIDSYLGLYRRLSRSRP